MKRNDNKKLREEAVKDLLAVVLKSNVHVLSPLYKTMLEEVLINEKTFGELKGTLKLTIPRQKTVFQQAVKSLRKGLQNMHENLNLYSEIETELLRVQDRVKVLERKLIDENSISPDSKKLFSVPISEVGFSARVQQICFKAKIYTIADLVRISKNEFLGFRNSGKKSADEVEAYLLKNNLSWKMKIDVADNVL